MEKTHNREGKSTNDIQKDDIIEFDFWDREHEMIHKPIPRFKPGNRFNILGEILYCIEEEGFLDNHKILLALFTYDRAVIIDYRIRWTGTTASLIRLFLELIKHNILDSSELNSLSTKLPKIFSYLNKKGEYVPVKRSAVQSYKNFNISPDSIKGNEEVKSVNCLMTIILDRIKNK